MGLSLGLVFLLAFQWSCGSKSAAPSAPSGGGGTTYTYPFKFSFGGSGAGTGQFNGILGLAVHVDGLFVSDSSNDRVQKFDLGGDYLGQWAGHTAFNPGGITFDKNGTLYVMDIAHNEIQTSDLNFNYKATYGPTVGSYTLNEAIGLGIDNSGVSILVADPLSGAVYRFNSTFSAGVSIAYPLVGPFGVAEDSSGNVYVADSSASVLTKFNSSLAAPITLAGSGTTNGLLSNPSSVAVDSDGNILVGDGSGRVQKLSPSGSYITQISGPGSNPGQFGTEGLYVATDANKNVYVGDYANNVVDVFAPN